MSAAGTQAAEARRKALTTLGYYNLRIGPTAWKFAAGLTAEYNDNINNSGDNIEGDFIFRPEVDLQLLWPITDNNRLNLALGAGYSAYVNRSDLDRFFIRPGTELSFDIFVGDFVINLHDRVSLTEDAYQDPTVTGTADYARLENAAGVGALWDLNKVKLRAGFDHVNYVSYGSSAQPDGNSEVFSASATYMIKPYVSVGLELGAALVEYLGTNALFPSAKQWNFGGFYEAPLTEYMRFRVNLGYAVHSPDDAEDLPDNGEFSGLYAQLSLSHRLNQYVQHSLSAGRSINFDFYGGTVDLYYARWLVDWKLFRNISSNLSLEYEHGSDAGLGSEIFDRYGAQITLRRPITKKFSANIGYRFYWRTSNVPSGDYFVNIVSLGFRYDF